MSEGNDPLHLIEDEDTGDRFLVFAVDGGVRVDLQVAGDTFWASQKQMADAFGVTRPNITIHLRNIFEEGELVEAAVCKESLRTGSDGKRYVTKLYNLNVLISVGYRVGGKQGTAFRLWATDKLFQYLTRGFVIDARRLKAPGETDRIAELREIVRDIRASEANVYAELRRICAMCRDYDPASSMARDFFTRMQAKLFWATMTHTPSMVVVERANAAHPQMGLKTWAKHDILQSDATVAKNYLAPAELRELNRVTTILLDIFEDQIEIGRLTTMEEAASLLDAQLHGLNRAVLRHGGAVSHAAADAHAKSEYKKYDAERRAQRAEQTMRELAALKRADKALPKARSSRRRAAPPTDT